MKYEDKFLSERLPEIGNDNYFINEWGEEEYKENRLLIDKASEGYPLYILFGDDYENRDVLGAFYTKDEAKKFLIENREKIEDEKHGGYSEGYIIEGFFYGGIY